MRNSDSGTQSRSIAAAKEVACVFLKCLTCLLGNGNYFRIVDCIFNELPGKPVIESQANIRDQPFKLKSVLNIEIAVSGIDAVGIVVEA